MSFIESKGVLAWTCDVEGALHIEAPLGQEMQRGLRIQEPPAQSGRPDQAEKAAVQRHEPEESQ